MRLFRFFWISLAFLFAGAAPGQEKEKVQVLIKTEKGDVVVELDAARAPVTTANFLKYMDGRFYDGGRFHRTVRPDNQPDAE